MSSTANLTRTMVHLRTAVSHIIRLVVVFELSLAAVALGVGWLIGVSPLATLSWTPDGIRAAAWWAGVGVAAAMPLVGTLWLSDHYPWGPFRDLQQLVSTHILPLFAGASISELAFVAVAAGLGEELAFRGLIQAGLAGWWGAPTGWMWGLAVSSLLFGLCHAVSASYAVAAGLIGVYLGLELLWWNHVAAPIATHAAYDFMALVYLLRRHTPHDNAAVEPPLPSE